MAEDKGPVCTSASASWCPIHGDCCCDRERGQLDHPACPLHKRTSEHAPESGWGQHITCPWCGTTDEETTSFFATRKETTPDAVPLADYERQTLPGATTTEKERA